MSYFFLYSLFVLVSIPLTVINNFSAFCFDLHIPRINLSIIGAAPSRHCTVLSISWMPLPSYSSDSLSATQSFSLSFALLKFHVKLSQFSVLEFLSGVVSWSLLARWRLILFIQWTFNTLVPPLGRVVVAIDCGKGDSPNILNRATPSGLKFYQNALTILWLSEMYPTAVICLVWAWDSISVTGRIWLPCHISKKSWTLAILWNVLSFSSLQFQVVWSFRGIQCFVIAWQYPVMCCSKLP